MASVVMVMRHAEKPLGGGPPHGVTVAGESDAESLTPRGWQRAGALIGLFVPRPGGSSQLPTPSHLIASQIVGSGSKRTRETLVPLSERLGLVVDSRFTKQQVAELVGAVRALDGVVLIAWEHHMIPPIANLLAANKAEVPQVWPDDRYDLVWVFSDAGRGPGMEFREVPQVLLASDNPAPVGTPHA